MDENVIELFGQPRVSYDSVTKVTTVIHRGNRYELASMSLIPVQTGDTISLVIGLNNSDTNKGFGWVFHSKMELQEFIFDLEHLMKNLL